MMLDPWANGDEDIDPVDDGAEEHFKGFTGEPILRSGCDADQTRKARQAGESREAVIHDDKAGGHFEQTTKAVVDHG